MRTKFFILLVFLLSGFSALIYQVVWMRMLTQVFGATIFAVTTVITVFMVGLAFGSLVFGRWVDRQSDKKSLLITYAFIEASIGAYCLLTPWLFLHLDTLYAYIYQLHEIDFYLFSLIRLLFSLLILIVPTFLMGATLPVICKCFTTNKLLLGRSLGQLYALNTLGAVLGVLISAYVLLPELGITTTILIAVVINFVIALVVFRLARWSEKIKQKPLAVPPPQADQTVADKRRATRLWWVFALSGLAGLGYEVIWFRLLALTIGNSVYAFAMMLAVFLLGLALGSAMMAQFVDRIKNRLVLLAQIEMLIGFSVLALLPLFGMLPILFLDVLVFFEYSFWSFQVVNFITTLIAIIIPTLLMGAVFPLVVRIATTELHVLGRRVGSLYSVNTLGGAVGALLAGFILIPWIGMQGALMLFAGLNVALSVVLLYGSWRDGESTRVSVSLMIAGLVAVAIFMAAPPEWDRRLLTAGAYYSPDRLLQAHKTGQLKNYLHKTGKIVFYQEGITGTVSVTESYGNLSLAVDGKVTADIRQNALFNIILGSLALILHEQPKTALLIGLGSGVTLGAMEQFDLQEIDVIEISPEIVAANQLFAAYNNNALEDPRLRVLIDDGRTYVSYTRASYDVIINEPSLPFVRGVGSLFTVEFYQAVRARLNDKGIAVQWLNTYAMQTKDMKSVIATFKQVFPYATLWEYETGDIILLGSEEPLILNYERMVSRLKVLSVGKMMASIGLGTPELLIGGFTMGDKDLSKFSDGAPFNTYDFPLLEFSVPRNIFESTQVVNYNKMAAATPLARPRVVVSEQQGERRYGYMKLLDTLDQDWDVQFSGFNVRNNFIRRIEPGERPRIEKDVFAVVEWKKQGQNDGFSGFFRLRSVSADVVKINKGELGDYLTKFVPEPTLEYGFAKIHDNELLWRLHSVKEDRLLSLVWHCPENGRVYLGEFLSSYQGDDLPERFLKEVSAGLQCIHDADYFRLRLEVQE